MGGKGIRRREKNYAAAHGGGNSSRLPPPPALSSIDAIPSKLRKLMSLAGAAKHPLNHGKNNTGDGADKAARLGGRTESTTTGMKRKRDGQSSKEQGDDVPDANKNAKKKKRKSKKANDLRFEALDAAAAAGSRRKDRRKKLMEARKKKQEKSQTEDDLNFPGREHVKFGDIVEAPPKLTVPKAFKAQDASHERLRLQAVEAYRKRKAWGSRPGVKLPPPVTTS